MKERLSLLSIFTILVLVLTACGSEEATEIVEGSDEQLEVMVTMFAQYDFARQIGGTHINVQRLVAPGVDIHAYDPTAQDIIAINESDLFIYTGAEMEPWVHRILDSLDNDDLTILDVSTGVHFLPWSGDHDHHGHGHHHDSDSEDEHDHGHHHDSDSEDDHEHHHDSDSEDEHDHGHHHDSDSEDNHNHHHTDTHTDETDHTHDHHHHDHQHNYDPHIWTSPINAIVMAQNIQAYLTDLMPDHADYFADNAAALIAELEALDQDFRELMEGAERTTIYHAGRFAMHYLMHEYGIDFVAAPMESEPDMALVARMITEIETYDIPVIFHEELVNPQTANMIASETGAEAFVLHTIHNVSPDEIAAGETYISLMRHNLEVLRQALN